MRQHLNIHQSFDDPCQRFFNAIGLGSYIRPHRHLLDPKPEDLIAIRGLFAVVLFSDEGEVSDVVHFGTEKYAGIAAGVEVAPDTWHTVVALTKDAVLLELKAGPFDSAAAKDLAPWAPEEGTPEGRRYVVSLEKTIAGWDHTVDAVEPMIVI